MINETDLLVAGLTGFVVSSFIFWAFWREARQQDQDTATRYTDNDTLNK